MIVKPGLIILATLALAQSSAFAQVPAKASPELPRAISDAKVSLVQCAISSGTALAQSSQEGAEILAEVAVYRCVSASVDQRRFGDQDNARLAAADAIVKARIAK